MNNNEFPHLNPLHAAFCVVLLVACIAFLNYQDNQVAQLIEQEQIAAMGDYSDSGVGCMDDCLEPASAPRVYDTLTLRGE